MTNAPFNFTIADQRGQLLFSQEVPFQQGITVRGITEQAFILSQTEKTPVPFDYEITFYGESQEGSGLLGYDIATMCGRPNHTDNYWWAIFVNQTLSPTGQDNTHPPAGANVEWLYMTNHAQPGTQAHEVQSRHRTRRSKR